MAAWMAVRARVPVAREDEIAMIVAETGALGAEVAEPRAGLVEVVVYLNGAAAIELVGASLAAIGAADLAVETVAAHDWLAGYRASVQPFAVGRRWWIDPHPDTPTPAPAGRLRLVIEPRMAFGSGSHESTRLVLLELESDPPRGRSVLDVGTGSGVLALAAERLGAGPVVGFDLDPEAIWVARQTALSQETPSAVALFVGTTAALVDGTFDVVLCNMVSEQFLPLVEALRAQLAATGSIVFSGVLMADEDAVRQQLLAHGLTVSARRTDGEWVALRVRHG